LVEITIHGEEEKGHVEVMTQTGDMEDGIAMRVFQMEISPVFQKQFDHWSAGGNVR
jgi:hypothetical protein